MVIKPNIKIINRVNSKVGPLGIRIGGFEAVQKNSSLAPEVEVHSKLEDLANDYGGLMIFRDGLRVMPYGREDNDFFMEIEKRRSKNAGIAFGQQERCLAVLQLVEMVALI